MVYHLFSYAHNHQIILKVDLPRDNPKIATLEEQWKVANWFEREVYDLFGVIFEGHSDLRRIMLPEDWVGLSRCAKITSSRKNMTASAPNVRRWWKSCCDRI